MTYAPRPSKHGVYVHRQGEEKDGEEERERQRGGEIMRENEIKRSLEIDREKEWKRKKNKERGKGWQIHKDKLRQGERKKVRERRGTVIEQVIKERKKNSESIPGGYITIPF